MSRRSTALTTPSTPDCRRANRSFRSTRRRPFGHRPGSASDLMRFGPSIDCANDVVGNARHVRGVGVIVLRDAGHTTRRPSAPPSATGERRVPDRGSQLTALSRWRRRLTRRGLRTAAPRVLDAMLSDRDGRLKIHGAHGQRSPTTRDVARRGSGRANITGVPEPATLGTDAQRCVGSGEARRSERARSDVPQPNAERLRSAGVGQRAGALPHERHHARRGRASGSGPAA